MKIGNLEVYGIIYKITNKVNNKVYIGQTIRRFNDRYSASGEGIERVYNYHKKYKNYRVNKYNDHLLYSIEKYGFSSFTIDINLDYAFSDLELNIKEKCWIKYYNSNEYEYGYNKNDGGNSARPNSETRKKLSIANKGKRLTEEHKQKIREYQRNRPESHNRNMSIAKKGKPSSFKGKHLPISARITLSNYAKIRTGEKNPFWGKQHTKESLAKFSGANSCHSKKVVCINTGEVFVSLREAAKKYNIKYPETIGRCCSGKYKSTGVYNNTKLIWKWYEDVE